MPLDLHPRVIEMKNSGDAETQWALDLTFTDGTTIYVAQREIFDGAKTYLPNLRKPGSLKQSLRRTTDGIELAIQNVDKLIGGTVFSVQNSLNRATGILWTLWIDYDGTVYPVERMRGDLTGARGRGHTRVTFKLISDLNANRRVRGNRSLSPSCSFGYKTDRRCGSTDSSPTCSRLFDGPNGCGSKAPAVRITQPTATNNQPSFGGFLFRDEQPPSQPTPSLTLPIYGSPVDDYDRGSPQYTGPRYGRIAMPMLDAML